MSILPFIVTTLFTIANDSAEQLAFNYFASEIIDKNYPNSKVIYYSGQTEGVKSIGGPFARCYESDTDFSQFYYQQKSSETQKLNIESSNFSRLRKSSKVKLKHLNMIIYRAVTNGKLVYV